jgi:hypothetical protein
MHTIELNPGGINGPPQVATLTLNSKGEPEARILSDDELEEHKNNVESAEKYLSQYRQILNSPPTAGEPTLPTK